MKGMPASWMIGRGCQHQVGVAEADDGDDVILLDELLRDLRGQRHVVARVVRNAFKLTTEHATGGVDLFDRQQRAVGGRQVKRELGTGQVVTQAQS